MYEGNHLASQLRAASLGREDAVFLNNIQTKKEVSFGEFFANAERMAALLCELGLRPADRVAVQAEKTQAMLELYVGALLAGVVFLPLNPAYTANEVEYFLRDATPSLLICDPKNYETLNPLALDCSVETVLTLAADESGSLVELRNKQAPGFQAIPRKGDDLAALLYTSGTTGRSKGAMLTHSALASNSQALKEYWHFTSDDVLIHALPIFHTHGLFVATNISLMTGSKCIFMNSFDAETIRDYMPQATTLMGVPTFYVRLLKTPDLAEAAADMRLFVSGSAPLLEETHNSWSEITGHKILERYGMTETNMNTSNPYAGERRAGTVGFPLPGIEVVVNDPDTGKEMAVGEIGILEVRGPNVFAGYWKMPEKTKEELRENGFFITGDLGKIDTDGYVHIVGRSKDLIITGGYNVYPKEIEILIDDMEGVYESAVIGVPHNDFGETVVAAVVLNQGFILTQEKILELLSPTLARFKQPRKIIIVKELPRNAMGKVQKNMLRLKYKNLFV